MAKGKKTVDFSKKVEKISEEHLAKIQENVKGINLVQLEVGKLESQKHAFLHKLNELQSEMNALQVQLNEEYGTCDINVADGTINRTEDEQ